MNPLVSIILTSYNQRDSLQIAFESLLNQTYKNIEIIIVDDCSTDNKSQKYIQHLSRKYPELIRYNFQKRNSGVSANKNMGIKIAKGEYLSYLDGDDFYYPDKIENEIEKFRLNPDLDVVYSNFNYCSSDYSVQSAWKKEFDFVHEGNIFKHIISRNFPRYTLYRFELINMKALESIDHFDENLQAFEDWDLRIRYSANSKIGYCDNIGSGYVMNEHSISKSSKKLDLAIQMQKVFYKNRNLLRKTLPRTTSEIIEKNFLESSCNSILHHIDIKANLLLYIKTKLILALL